MALRVAVLASGEGTTLQALLDVCDGPTVQVVLVISNNSQSGALRRARAAGIPVLHLSSHTHPDAELRDTAIRDALAGACTDVVLLAGYVKKLGPVVLREFEGRVLNTHPALLPNHGGQGMFGGRVHEAVLAAQDRETGVSVHVVGLEYDTGDVIAQCRVFVLSDDSVETLTSRVQAREREFLVETLLAIARGELKLP